MVEKDSFDHVVKTTAQWESQSFEYWIIPRGVLCVELTPDKKTKIKIGEGNKIYSQLPYINSETDLSDYYTKEEIDNILALLNFVAIPSTEIYPTKESLPQTGNRQGDLRFVLNTGGDPYSYLWFNNKWIQVGGVDLSEYAKKSEVNPRLNALELKAHTHANKSVLDRLTGNVIDDSHRHSNKNILDATTAPYTTQDKATLDGLAAITIFEGATKTEDGTIGYVPAPLQGQQTYFLKGDGSWAYLAPSNKYKAGEGIYILSGEATSDTFPFNIYSRGNQVKQYIIYGNTGGVGELVNGEYHIPVVVSAPGHPDRTSVIILSEPMYDGDYIDFEKQVFAHYRTDITSQIQHPDTDGRETGISSAGNLYWKSSYRGYGGNPRVTDYFELESDASYEISKIHPDNDFSDSLNINLYDENKNRTRTIVTSKTSSTGFSPNENEKYMRQSYAGTQDGYCHVFKLKATETPCSLQEVLLYPNAINSINIDTTVKPAEAYFEVLEPEEPDPEDPLSEYTGIIYNDGVLDVTQEDPNNLNELTFHFRDDVDKTLTIPTAALPIASDTTLGGIKVGANLTIDPVTGVLDATGGGGTEYAAGDGIQIDEGTSVIDITNIEWQQGKINDSDGTEAISDVEPYLDCEMFEITSHTSMVTLSGTYTNNIMLLWKPYYYDENENYISTTDNWSTYEDGIQIPINAKYVRFVLTEDETTALDPNDLAHVEIEYPLEVGKEVITNTGVIDVQVRDRKLIIIKHDHVEEIPIPDPPLATTTTPGIVVVGEDLTIDADGVLNIADINRLILNAEE